MTFSATFHSGLNSRPVGSWSSSSLPSTSEPVRGCARARQARGDYDTHCGQYDCKVKYLRRHQPRQASTPGASSLQSALLRQQRHAEGCQRGAPVDMREPSCYASDHVPARARGQRDPTKIILHRHLPKLLTVMSPPPRTPTTNNKQQNKNKLTTNNEYNDDDNSEDDDDDNNNLQRETQHLPRRIPST